MEQAPDDYTRNYFHQNTLPVDYDDYYVDNYPDIQGNVEDAYNLQTPNTRLYTEGPEEVENREYYKPYQRPKTSQYKYDVIQQYTNDHPHLIPNPKPKNYYNIQYDNYYSNYGKTMDSQFRGCTNNALYGDCNENTYYGYGSRQRRAPVKKYPITTKTPKYVTKNMIPATVTKKPSALCLPVVTRPDPALVRRKSKSNVQMKKESAPQSGPYSAHKMHSQGDVKNELPMEEFHTYDNERDNIEGTDETFKEFVKFIKPRVPSSIKTKQVKINRASQEIQPKMKLSLDKLLNRLQKCECNEDFSDESCKSEPENKNESADNKTNINKTSSSFNYDSISKKCPPNPSNDSTAVSKNLAGPLKQKKSANLIKPMDDHCALDLHRSKSYIVDLIDRALSKELGTVPRDQSVHHNLTPNKAVATISRHRQGNPKELCYEVTAALTDSIISNATAPRKEEMGNEIVEHRTSDGQIKEKTGDDGYIKQLKQLRWGHIRHIQHEARKLADLEEFLEKCGEIEY